ncbi:MAG TPA: hypothetical protein VK594_14830, partial [Streptosporangiaceae bacterium]|nr:hypothetical protein [Streptosporangiaceae bacterium]
MPSLPVTDDGSARPLTEDLSTGSGGGEDITCDADTAEAGEVPAPGGAASGTRPAGAEPRDSEAGDGPEMAGPEMAGPDAAPAIGESGRWFRPAKAKKKYAPIPPEDQADSAGLDVAPADPEPDGAVATQDAAEPDGAEATQEPPEQAAELAASPPAGPAEAEAGADGDGDAAAADWVSQEQPEWLSPQEARPVEV